MFGLPTNVGSEWSNCYVLVWSMGPIRSMSLWTHTWRCRYGANGKCLAAGPAEHVGSHSWCGAPTLERWIVAVDVFFCEARDEKE